MSLPDGHARACRVERLRLRHFRNYEDETVELGPGLTVLTGRNAQGKTSLLEAVATLALTRSPRAASALELVRWGDTGCLVQARIERPDGPVALDMRVERVAGSVDRVVRRTLVDGDERPARELLGVCPVVLFWPEDLQLVKGGPDARRRLLDIVLGQTDRRVAAELIRYRRVLEQRNALLKQVRQGAAPAGSLQGFTHELVRCGGYIQVARLRLCTQLGALAATALGELSARGEELTMAYVAEGIEQVTDDTEHAAAALAAVLASRRGEELARGVTVAGPHRDDVTILMNSRPARSAASQGQQRSAVLAIKLAEVRYVGSAAGMSPVLLLDDVLSELDAGRRSRLLELLGATDRHGQALLTTTEDAAVDIATLGAARRLVVEAGRVREEPLHAGGAVA